MQVDVRQHAVVEVDAALAEPDAEGADHGHRGVLQAADLLQAREQALELLVEVPDGPVVLRFVLAERVQRAAPVAPRDRVVGVLRAADRRDPIELGARREVGVPARIALAPGALEVVQVHVGEPVAVGGLLLEPVLQLDPRHLDAEVRRVHPRLRAVLPEALEARVQTVGLADPGMIGEGGRGVPVAQELERQARGRVGDVPQGDHRRLDVLRQVADGDERVAAGQERDVRRQQPRRAAEGLREGNPLGRQAMSAGVVSRSYPSEETWSARSESIAIKSTPRPVPGPRPGMSRSHAASAASATRGGRQERTVSQRIAAGARGYKARVRRAGSRPSRTLKNAPRFSTNLLIALDLIAAILEEPASAGSSRGC